MLPFSYLFKEDTLTGSEDIVHPCTWECLLMKKRGKKKTPLIPSRAPSKDRQQCKL